MLPKGPFVLYKIYNIIFEHGNNPPPSPVWTMFKKMHFSYMKGSLRIRTSFKFSNQFSNLCTQCLYLLCLWRGLLQILVKQNTALFSTLLRPSSSVFKVWHHTFFPVYDDLDHSYSVLLLLSWPIFPVTPAPPLNPSPPSPVTFATLSSFSEYAFKVLKY